VRRVVGKQVVQVSGDEFAALRAGYRDVLVDIGTGDGKHAYHLARRRPDTLVIGLDANRDNLRQVSQRAAAKPARGGLPNALFLWESAESPPPALRQVGELHVLMPWGSLLRGLFSSDGSMLRGLAELCADGARFLVTLNLHAWRPPVPEVGTAPEPTPASAMGPLAASYAPLGWHLQDAHYLSDSEIAELATSWTRRLGSSRSSLAVLGLTGHIGSGGTGDG
jgi:16S rRNA (adenine(1408)-N(1))-methyltransferase